jgi:hypothetical protein
MENFRGREFEFELPIGYQDDDGCVHRSAILRKMTGRDEAMMADKKNRHNGARMVTELLGSCLVRIGAIDRPGSRVAQALYSADRYYLFIKLREITFGPELQASYVCPTCRESTMMVEDLSELEVVKLAEGELPEDMVVHLEDGYYERNGACYDTMIFRYPTGMDEEKIASIIRENPSHGKNALMARCLKAIGDMPQQRIDVLGTSIFSELTLGDRAAIDRKLNNGGPGIKMRRDLSCDTCGRQFTTSLDMSNFLAPS